jgi:hypothetical protein
MHIKIAPEGQEKTFVRKVTVSRNSPTNPSGIKEESFEATFIERDLTERQELQRNASNDVEYVRGFVKSVNITGEHNDGTPMSQEEVYEYAIRDPEINGALIATYLKSRSRNLKV